MSLPTPTPVQRCLDRHKTGDPTARDDVFRLCQDRLRLLTERAFFGYRRLNRWVTSDDVYQNAMFRLDQCLQQIAPLTTRDLLNLAACHVRRTLIDLIRHYYGPQGEASHHHTPPAGSFGKRQIGQLETVVYDGDPSNLAIWSEFHTMVGELPPELREVFQMWFYHGLSKEEIAVEIGMSVKTVSRRLLQARDLLASSVPIDVVIDSPTGAARNPLGRTTSEMK